MRENQWRVHDKAQLHAVLEEGSHARFLPWHQCRSCRDGAADASVCVKGTSSYGCGNMVPNAGVTLAARAPKRCGSWLFCGCVAAVRRRIAADPSALLIVLPKTEIARMAETFRAETACLNFMLKQMLQRTRMSSRAKGAGLAEVRLRSLPTGAGYCPI